MSKKVLDVVGHTTVTDANKVETTTEHKVGIVLTDGPTAEVGCELSFTKNLGNYQSARMAVSLKCPSNLDPDSLDKTFKFAKEWCDGKLNGMVQEAEESLG